MKSRYDRKTRDVVLTGCVTQLRKPQARAVVEYSSLSTSPGEIVVVSTGTTTRVRASAAGTFTIRARVTKTTFFLDGAATTGPCEGPLTAPGRCLSETVEGTATKAVRVSAPAG